MIYVRTLISKFIRMCGFPVSDSRFRTALTTSCRLRWGLGTGNEWRKLLERSPIDGVEADISLGLERHQYSASPAALEKLYQEPF